MSRLNNAIYRISCGLPISDYDTNLVIEHITRMKNKSDRFVSVVICISIFIIIIGIII